MFPDLVRGKLNEKKKKKPILEISKNDKVEMRLLIRTPELFEKNISLNASKCGTVQK